MSYFVREGNVTIAKKSFVKIKPVVFDKENIIFYILYYYLLS